MAMMENGNMASIIEIYYNPYIPKMGILLDGKQPPEYSCLIQFSDTDIWEWNGEILPMIYREIRESFYVVFTGTFLDIEIMRHQCFNYEPCIGFKAGHFCISDSLQKRLGWLNQIIKKHRVSFYKITNIHAFFDIAGSLKKYADEICLWDIKNLFCRVKVEILNTDSSEYKEDKNNFLFILSDSVSEGIRRLKKYDSSKWIYVICLGNQTGLHSFNENGLIYEVQDKDVFETVFMMLLHRPLLEALRNCIKSLSDKLREQDEVRIISLVEPMVKIELKSQIEIGRSNPIHVRLEPPIGKMPKLQFKVVDSKIGECDGMNVFGRQEGYTRLDVYRFGEKIPFYTQRIKVIERKRITKLVLSEDELMMGVGDKKILKCDFFPDDADNKNMIRWKSSDENIVSVDYKGCIKALKGGKCRILCVAENVSVSCMCQVKPYLEEIILNVPMNEKGSVDMEAGQEISMDIQLIPENCIDNRLQFESSDYDVVNVVNGMLMAKNAGKATISVINESERKNKIFDVYVSKRKAGFLERIFGK